VLSKLPHNIVILNSGEEEGEGRGKGKGKERRPRNVDLGQLANHLSGMDPLLDDGVKFAGRCRRLGVPVVQKVFSP
jgi:hypothetical protein